MSNRIAFAVLRVGPDALKSIGPMLKSRENAACISLRRAHLSSVITTLGTILTGTQASRHQVNTITVPRTPEPDGEDSDQTRSNHLQYRTSRMSGAPFAWNRLASRGIGTAVLNLPFGPAKDDDLVTEIPRFTIRKRAEAEGISMRHAGLGYVQGTVANRPDIRCVILTASFLQSESASSEDSGDDVKGQSGQDMTNEVAKEFSDQSEDSQDEVDREEIDPLDESAGQEVIDYLGNLAVASSSEHTLAIIMGQRMGCVVLLGPRASEVNRVYARSIACVPTILDLLGEPSAADLLGASLLSGGDAQDGDSGKSWALDGGEHQLPDWNGLIQRVRDGEATDNESSVLKNHLIAVGQAGLFESNVTSCLEETKILSETFDSPAAKLRLAFMLVLAGKQDEAKEQIQMLIDDHPESTQADIARLMPICRTDSETTQDILDRHPLGSIGSFIERGIWARAAAREGRDSDAIEALWSLILGGQAINHDRKIYATLALKRNEPGDARRAALVLRDMGSVGQGMSNGQPRPETMMLRARALAASGSIPQAKRLLASYLERYPQDNQVSNLLEKISAME